MLLVLSMLHVSARKSRAPLKRDTEMDTMDFVLELIGMMTVLRWVVTGSCELGLVIKETLRLRSIERQLRS